MTGVGKSALATQFATRHFVPGYSPTVENTISTAVIYDGKEYSIELVDAAGVDECCQYYKHYAIGYHGYILVFSVDSRRSFDNIRQVHDTIVEACGGAQVPLVLVGNKADLKERRVTSAEAGALANSWGCAYVECSPKLNQHVDDVFAVMLREVEKDQEFVVPGRQRRGSFGRRESCVIL